MNLANLMLMNSASTQKNFIYITGHKKNIVWNMHTYLIKFYSFIEIIVFIEMQEYDKQKYEASGYLCQGEKLVTKGKCDDRIETLCYY